MMGLRNLVSVLLLSFTAVSALGRAPRSIKELRSQTETSLKKRDVDPTTLYPAYNISVPIDHFFNDSKYEPHTNGTFNLRYWFDASHYLPGGPVIVLESGETDGTDRLPYLQKGILAQLANATNGIGVVLEHRYYGESWPVSDLSTESLRFLTTDQALADTAYFAQNVVFEGLENVTLTAPTTPWIAYGGSYAGAFVAFLRTLYPDTFFGAISSSGVTEAIYDYWAYFEAIRLFGPQACIRQTQEFVQIIDDILIGKNDTDLTQSLKDVFGLGNITYDDDFANTVADGIYGWQSTNWDPAVTDPSFYEYCGNITTDSIIYNETSSKGAEVYSLILESGYNASASVNSTTVNRFLNWIGWQNLTYTSSCTESQDACFSLRNATYYAQDDITQTWRSWPYQYCTEWGYLQTGSGVPADIQPLISRTIDIPYTSIPCRDAFNITTPSDVEVINKYGGYNISYPRLAIIDGQADPWRYATPHAPAAPNRTSTTSQPFIEIPGAVHHWDENGLFPNETTATLPPPAIVDTQQAEAAFVQAWLQDFKVSKRESRKLVKQHY